MGVKEIAVSIVESEPCRAILTALGESRTGRRLLNRLSAPFGVYDTFDEGWLAARRAKPTGHEHPDDVKIHLALSKSLRPSDYAVLYWLSRLAAEELSVFDFGGNVGNLYYSYLPYLRYRSQTIEWTVFDLAPIIEEGRILSAQREAPELKFTSSPRDAPEKSIVLVSGAFHYWEKSIPEFLEQFTKPPTHIILNRSPVHEKYRSFVTVQRTESYAVPCIVRNAQAMIQDFAAAGYTMVDRWSALELRLRLPLFPDRSVQRYSGFYFRHQ